MENKNIQNLETELEISKKEKTKSLFKSVGIGILPLATAAGLYFLDNVINSNIDKTVLTRIADYINSNLPLINVTVNGLERIRDYLFVGLTIGTLKQTGAMSYWYKTTNKLLDTTKKYTRKVKWTKRELENKRMGFSRSRTNGLEDGLNSEGDDIEYMAPEGDIIREANANKGSQKITIESGHNQAYFENANAYAMLARAVDISYPVSNPSAKTLSPKERHEIPDWEENFFELANSSKGNYDFLTKDKVVTEDAAGDALRKVLLSHGIID